MTSDIKIQGNSHICYQAELFSGKVIDIWSRERIKEYSFTADRYVLTHVVSLIKLFNFYKRHPLPKLKFLKINYIALTPRLFSLFCTNVGLLPCLESLCLGNFYYSVQIKWHREFCVTLYRMLQKSKWKTKNFTLIIEGVFDSQVEGGRESSPRNHFILGKIIKEGCHLRTRGDVRGGEEIKYLFAANEIVNRKRSFEEMLNFEYFIGKAHSCELLNVETNFWRTQKGVVCHRDRKSWSTKYNTVS